MFRSNSFNGLDPSLVWIGVTSLASLELRWFMQPEPSSHWLCFLSISIILSCILNYREGHSKCLIFLCGPDPRPLRSLGAGLNLVPFAVFYVSFSYFILFFFSGLNSLCILDLFLYDSLLPHACRQFSCIFSGPVQLRSVVCYLWPQNECIVKCEDGIPETCPLPMLISFTLFKIA